jgi:hypothetical protein
MDDDDALFRSSSINNNDEIEVTQESTVMTLQQIVMPLKVSDMMDDYFLEVLANNASSIHLNIFLLGYRCDQGVRACGGRSGAELGCETVREVFFQKHTVLASQLKECGVQIYDLGDITKYQLSIYQNSAEDQKDIDEKITKSLSEIIDFIIDKIPKSKVIVIGGSDDVCKGIHEGNRINEIIHIDSQIDTKARYKHQL